MTTTLTAPNSLSQFKQGVDSLLEKRDYFIQRILPKLEEGRDFYTIKGRKSLGKAGAEKLATIYQLIATFNRDTDTIESFRGIEGLVAFVCVLERSGGVGGIMGQGRGAAVLKSHGNDANKTIKMAQKSAFIDAVIRTTGLSDIFTSDLEDMPVENVVATLPGEHKDVSNDKNYFPKNTEEGDTGITAKQKDLLISLISERIASASERERWFQEVESCSKFDASEMISSFLMRSSR